VATNEVRPKFAFATDVEHSDSLGRVQLVRGEREVIDSK
jgi:hypothetical protein